MSTILDLLQVVYDIGTERDKWKATAEALNKENIALKAAPKDEAKDA